jgi:hypothetical protein
MDTVVDVCCVRRCVVCVVIALPFLQPGTYLGICRPFLSSDFVSRFCGQILSTKLFKYFIEPSAKPARARVLGTN